MAAKMFIRGVMVGLLALAVAGGGCKRRRPENAPPPPNRSKPRPVQPARPQAGDDSPRGRRWRLLCQTPGCLSYSEYWGPGRVPASSVLSESVWRQFFAERPAETVPFLLSRLDSRIPTEVHVCPDENAGEGELALYALQRILHVNWYQYDGQQRTLLDAAERWDESPQERLRLVLADPSARAELKAFFLRRLARH